CARFGTYEDDYTYYLGSW
nr:immunoglobulin heavy chain junction region [Macaca mulatta]